MNESRWEPNHRRLPLIVSPCSRRSILLTQLLGISLTVCLGLAVQAAEEATGQQDLDRATLVKLSAKSLSDLETAIELCESALQKGVDAGNESYAKELLTATLYEHASQLCRLIFDQQPVDPRWPRARQLAMKDLERALEVDPDMGSAHLLIGRLQALPGGDDDRARKAIDAAIRLLRDDPEQLSIALVARGRLTEDRDATLADFNRALELDPRNLDALRMRALLYLERGEGEKALEDFEKLLQLNPNDLLIHQAAAQALRGLQQYDKALEHLDQVILAEPRAALAYVLRAQILEEMGKVPEAIQSLSEAITVEPKNLGALLARARLYVIQDQFDLARQDVDQVLRLQPRLPQAILLRSLVSAAQEQFTQAIGDLLPLVRRNPDNLELKMQLATYYEADRRLAAAIELYTEILQADPDQWLTLRRRGDAYLSQGKQQEAIQDYEAALKLRPEDSGILNNLAWVLATSPNDPLRNGQRSLELAQKACELTEYQQAHILSTLAASYAELGNFEEAIKWSSKAVELDAEEEQLAKELASYQDRKPWREQQQVKENTEPLPAVVEEEDLPFDELPIEESTEEATETPANEAPAEEKSDDDPPDLKPPSDPSPSEQHENLDKVDVPALPLR
jgi:tetratricopeptide (TPR) repeat protein